MIRSAVKPASVLVGLVGLVLAVSACSPAPVSSSQTTVAPTTSSAGATTPASSAPVAPTTTAVTPSPTPTVTKAAKPVHVSLLESDGASYGVGMPIIAWFNVAPTDIHAFSDATTVTVNGAPAHGAWFFEKTLHAGSVVEGHYRLSTYWPAHASIKMNLPVKGLSAGAGLAYDDSLTLAISTTAAHISTVDARTLKMTVKTDGKVYGVFPVSLGAADTPTVRGTKVIMEKGKDISMKGPGYYDPHVQWTQRLTYDGEYLHSAPWNVNNLGVRSTSNGCTNLAPVAAKQLYGFLGIGDVVLYPNASGPQMSLGAGYGDWNVNWTTWLTGGLYKTA